MALSVQNGWERRGLDIKTAFLNASLDEEIFVAQPEGFIKPGFEDYVYFLRKAIYCIQQSSRQWHTHLDKFLKTLEFEPTWAYPLLYVFHDDDKIALL